MLHIISRVMAKVGLALQVIWEWYPNAADLDLLKNIIKSETLLCDISVLTPQALTPPVR